MGFISREQWLAQQERKNTATNAPNVGYFSLKEDNQEAVVRFNYATDNDIFNDIIITHKVTVDGKFRRVNCLRNFNEALNKCPMCQSGDQSQQRLYIKLLEYTRNEDGSITATPKIWERPTSYVNMLLDKFAEYGDLSDCIFKVRRHGKAGDMKTTYSVDLANQTVYNSNLYKKDFSGFEGYNVVGTAVLDKNFDELAEMLGSMPAPAAPNTTPAPEQVQAPRKVSY